MSSSGLVEYLDYSISAFFASANGWTAVLAGIVVVLLLWPILNGGDPDIHPFLLARQAQASPVRQPGESAIYRANDIPIGFPLRSGLGHKDPGEPGWRPGRDGDIRDVWRRAIRGPTNEEGASTGPKGKLLTILGKEKVIENNLDEVTKAINAIGSLIKEQGYTTVAVSLSNSVELLATVFASAFYGFKPVLIPYGVGQKELQKLLGKTSAQVLIAEAGSVVLKPTVDAAPSIKEIIWVAKEGSRHLDWDVVPDDVPITTATWHNVVKERDASSEIPASEEGSKPGPVAAFVKNKAGEYECYEYSSGNMVAGIGGLLSTIVRDQKLTTDDLLLPTLSLTETYALCWVMAALYCHSSVALNSVSGEEVHIAAAATGISPTIIVASSVAVTKFDEKVTGHAHGVPQMISYYFQKQEFRAGRLPHKKPGSLGPAFQHLRALFVAQRDSDPRVLHSTLIANLRLGLGTRVCYALTSGRVAGAVCQTNIFDYRLKGRAANVGSPVNSLEVYLYGPEDWVGQEIPKGKIAVRGPSVVDGRAVLAASAKIENDRTVTLLQ